MHVFTLLLVLVPLLLVLSTPISLFFFFNDTATTEIYTLSLHDALPISRNSARYGAWRRCGPQVPRYSWKKSLDCRVESTVYTWFFHRAKEQKNERGVLCYGRDGLHRPAFAVVPERERSHHSGADASPGAPR